VGSIKRAPTPPGPITELFIRLDDLHSKAGRPSMREIASRAGRGNISSTTVHNIFRSSRVPRWFFLEQVVKALGGEQDRGKFLTLWEAAWRAENDLALSDALPHRDPAPQGGIKNTAEGLSRPPQRIWSNEIPPRNLNFTGRVTELKRMRDNLESQQPPRVQVVSGMGGIGKTEIATEYIHRNFDKYEIIWWIRSEHHDRVRDALVKLGQRLELPQATTDGDRDRTITAVLATLQSEGRASWLLVFDNVANPLELQKYLPDRRPRGHIIVTSRQLNWPSYIAADGIEVSPFTEEDAIRFLRRRVPGLAVDGGREKLTLEENEHRASEAGRLAAKLGHLPIAIDHAAAYLAETSQSVEEYLTSLRCSARIAN
jgi:NB-ARC domain